MFKNKQLGLFAAAKRVGMYGRYKMTQSVYLSIRKMSLFVTLDKSALTFNPISGSWLLPGSVTPDTPEL